MAHRPNGIAQVVQAVEVGDQIVAAAGEVGRARHLEEGAVGDSLLGGQLAGPLDRGGVEVEAEEAGFG